MPVCESRKCSGALEPLFWLLWVLRRSTEQSQSRTLCRPFGRLDQRRSLLLHLDVQSSWLSNEFAGFLGFKHQHNHDHHPKRRCLRPQLTDRQGPTTCLFVFPVLRIQGPTTCLFSGPEPLVSHQRGVIEWLQRAGAMCTSHLRFHYDYEASWQIWDITIGSGVLQRVIPTTLLVLGWLFLVLNDAATWDTPWFQSDVVWLVVWLFSYLCYKKLVAEWCNGSMAEGQEDLLEPLQPAGSYGQTYRASNWEQQKDLDISFFFGFFLNCHEYDMRSSGKNAGSGCHTTRWDSHSFASSKL